MNIWRLTFERPFSLTKLSLLRFNAITAHTRARQKRRLEFAGFVRDTHGVETRTVSIERLTVRLGAAQSQGVASFGLFVLPVTRCHCDRRCAHVVSHMGSWARTGRKGSFFFYKTQIVTRSQIKYCCLWKKNELKIRAISILVKKKEASFRGKTGSPSSLIELCQQQPSHLSFSPPSLPSSPKWKADYCLYSKVARQSAKTIFNSGHCSSLFALTPTGMRRLVS